ncbi:MAG: hypothetical protein ACRDRJ_49940 [Streptosporangiaceae bacterium]
MSQSQDHLKPGQLGTADVTASTVANIGPGIDFYFGFGVIAVTAGVAAPLTILAATVAVALLAFAVAEFTRAEPSAGSFITYVETALGGESRCQRAVLSGIPFSWGHLTGGLAGLSAGFPLALFMFIRWENGPALAEESRNPRRTIPRALFISVAIAAALLVFLRLRDHYRFPL